MSIIGNKNCSNLLSVFLSRLFLLFLFGLQLPTWSAKIPLAEKLGYKAMKINGHLAIGERPLLIVLLTDTNNTPLAHPLNYYERLVFGPNTNPSSPNIADYFKVISQKKFTWKNAGVVGPFVFSPSPNSETNNARIKRMLVDLGVDFNKFDLNNDRKIEDHELGILQIDTFSNDAGVVTHSNPLCTSIQRPGPQRGLQLCQHIAAAGHQSSWATYAHELAHLLGTIDLYGAGAIKTLNQNVSLMSVTRTGFDDPKTYFLDPWHRFQLGWLKPKMIALSTLQTQNFSLSAPQSYLPENTRTVPAVLLYDDLQEDSQHYLLLEFRNSRVNASPTQPWSFDQALPGYGPGFVLWSVTQEGPEHKPRYEPAPGASDPRAHNPMVRAIGEVQYEAGQGNLHWPLNRTTFFLGEKPGSTLPIYIESELVPDDASQINLSLTKTGFSAITTVADQAFSFATAFDGPHGLKLYTLDELGQLSVRQKSEEDLYFSRPINIALPQHTNEKASFIEATNTWDGREINFLITNRGLYYRFQIEPSTPLGNWIFVQERVTTDFRYYTNGLVLDLEFYFRNLSGQIFFMREKPSDTQFFTQPQLLSAPNSEFFTQLNLAFGDGIGGAVVIAQKSYTDFSFIKRENSASESWGNWQSDSAPGPWYDLFEFQIPGQPNIQFIPRQDNGQLYQRQKTPDDTWTFWETSLTLPFVNSRSYLSLNQKEQLQVFSRNPNQNILLVQKRANLYSGTWSNTKMVAPHFWGPLRKQKTLAGKPFYFYRQPDFLVRYFEEL